MSYVLSSNLLDMLCYDISQGIKLDRECLGNIVKNSSSAPAFALNLLDALIPKEVQRISNIKGSNGKTPLNTSILAAIKGNNPCLCHSQDSML